MGRGDVPGQNVGGGEFDQFAAAQMRPLLGFAHALTGNPHDAWDLTQETLVRVASKWRRVHSNPGAYARTTMVRLNIDRGRQVGRESPTESLPDVEVAADESVGADRWLVDALARALPAPTHRPGSAPR